MSIQGEIDRLSAAKTAIASALETMGIEPPEGTTLDQYAAQLTAIAASAPWLDKSTYDPQNKAQDVFGYVDSVAEGLIEYVDFTVTDEPLNGGYRAISNKTFDEVVALLKAGKTVIGRIVQTAGDKFYYSALTVSNAMDMGEGSVKQICFSSYFDDSIKSNSTTIIMEQTYTIATQCGSLHIPTPDDTADNGKVLMAQNGDPAWSPMPTAGELGALPISGGTMTGPLTLSGDPAEDLQAAPKQYVDKLGLPIVTTEGDGAAYTATVPGITALTAGASFIMIPHTVSTTTNPTLNVNNLGAKNIKRGLSTISTSNSIGNSSNWLSVGRPLLMVYDGLLWKVVNMTKPDAADLNGTLPVVNGGTGYNTFADSTYTAARYRASALYNTETAPTVNGVINWTYE